MTKGKVLVTEDDFVVAESLRAELESMGYEVEGMASSGQETLDLARQKKPDLVLMDIKLTGEMDGIETAINFAAQVGYPGPVSDSPCRSAYSGAGKTCRTLGLSGQAL